MLRAQQQFGRVGFPARVETLEAARRKADGRCSGEVEVAAVEEVEEGVLEDFGPDFEVFEIGAAGLCGGLVIGALVLGCLGMLMGQAGAKLNWTRYTTEAFSSHLINTVRERFSNLT